MESRKNGILGEDEEYLKILDAELGESDGSGDEALEFIINGVKLRRD